MATLYTYISCDHLVRTRCGRHVPRYGPRAINRSHEVLATEKNQPPHRCIECLYEWLETRGDMHEHQERTGND